MPLPPPYEDTQYVDERCGLVFPWFTKPFLDQLKNWDLSNKRVFEYGGGASTLWWAEYAKEVITVECNDKWVGDIVDSAIDRHYTLLGKMPKDSAKGMYYQLTGVHSSLRLMNRPVVPGEVELKSAYVNSIYEADGEFDLIIVDGSYRDECIAAALTKIKDGGIIICDNWDQEGVWDSIMGARLLDPWPANLFVEPSRSQDLRPWKTGFWQIYKRMQEKLGDPCYPSSLLAVTNDYNSHRPMLWMALEHIKPGLVVELGSGFGSTPLLTRYCTLQGRGFRSLETNLEWSESLEGMTMATNTYLLPLPPTAILFIDSAPGEERKELMYLNRNIAKVIIVHDTELTAEYVYHLQDALNSFKYRCDLIVDGCPQTTAVSNFYDFERWKGVTLGKYKFI